MRKFLFFFFIVMVSVFRAVAEVSPQDITMVSYEQSWLDIEGTFALKNNTEQTITSVTFRVTYQDMKENPLDYADYTKDIEIAPGMVRKINVPAYEHGRKYHYFKTSDEFDHPSFRLRFKLIGYRVQDKDDFLTVSSAANTRHFAGNVNTAGKDSVSRNRITGSVEALSQDVAMDPFYEDYETSSFRFPTISAQFIYWYLLSFVIGLYILVAFAARDRHRSIVIWLLLSILFTPLLMFIILCLKGDNRSRRYSNENIYNKED